MKEIIPLINGREFGWADIAFSIGGIPVSGITAIKYEEEQEKEDIYGAGRTPVTRGYGRIKIKASITLLGSTVMALTAQAPEGKLHRISPFPVTVSYIPDGKPIKTDILKRCEFKKTSFDWKEGDMSKEIEFELLVSEITSKI